MASMAPTFAEATAVRATGSHTYAGYFPSEWCIGSVTHGGVVTATLMRVAATHFGTTLAAQRQPHTILFHAEFLRRTRQGDVVFTVRDVKLGRQTSTVHITLTQDGRDEVVAYLTNADMAAETGLTLPTGWSPSPPLPPPPADFAKLAADGEDADWVVISDVPHWKLRKAVHRVRMYVPRAGQADPNVVDEWVRLESGEKLTMEGVGFVSDMWPQLMEGLVSRQEAEGKSPLAAITRSAEGHPWLWYPTLTLDLDFKKALPAEGVEWLRVRLQSKQVRNGRYDYEIVIFDDAGDIVALSHHAAMVVDGSRNTGARGAGGSKI
ncbi:thioesterase-like superfamily-domain-containing protein [Xylaria intraflava]|nr:thioesterase-like superfamily-domain-containing protein [Xylaria intraflava]